MSQNPGLTERLWQTQGAFKANLFRHYRIDESI
jgi:hypothetical protein